MTGVGEFASYAVGLVGLMPADGVDCLLRPRSFQQHVGPVYLHVLGLEESVSAYHTGPMRGILPRLQNLRYGAAAVFDLIRRSWIQCCKRPLELGPLGRLLAKASSPLKL